MPEYECKICNYKTKIRNQLERHHSTKNILGTLRFITLGLVLKKQVLLFPQNLLIFPQKFLKFPQKIV